MKVTFLRVVIILAPFHGLFASQDVRDAISMLETYCSTSIWGDASTIMEWGVPESEYSDGPFLSASEAISNNWCEMLSDWDFYATNETARMLLERVMCHSGTNAYIGIWCGLLDINAANENKCPPETIFKFAFPSSSPLYQYPILNYDVPIISNCLYRTSLLFTNDANYSCLFSNVISGLSKEIVEEENTLEYEDWSQ